MENNKSDKSFQISNSKPVIPPTKSKINSKKVHFSSSGYDSDTDLSSSLSSDSENKLPISDLIEDFKIDLSKTLILQIILPIENFIEDSKS